MLLGLVSGLERRSIWLSQWMFSLYWVVLLLSAPLLLLPLGYLTNGSGWQGILNHPQAMGVFLVPFVALLIVAALLGSSSWTILVMAGTGVVAVWFTEARTALLAVAIGASIAR